jgi:hypothetical protein
MWEMVFQTWENRCMKDHCDSPRALLHNVEAKLITRVSVCALNVGRELMTQLPPGGEGPLEQVPEPRSGCTGQGHREVVDHDDLIPSCSED